MQKHFDERLSVKVISEGKAHAAGGGSQIGQNPLIGIAENAVLPGGDGAAQRVLNQAPE
jgi:hypothetical protein